MRVQLNLAPFACDYGDLWESVDLVVANRAELDIHFGTPDPRVAALRLFARGVRAVVATAGPGGAWWLEPERAFHVPAPRVAAVDTTAAGDVLAGVLAAELHRGAGPSDALRLAVHAASLAVTRPGAVPSIPSAAEIERLRRELAGGEP
ncbi:Sulfofructose kinase [bacterium HR39]|nr:Sulfofructose kinase [bacterium HR39]